MTKDEINRAVAEKVMGFEDCGNGKADWCDPETGDYYGGPFEDFNPSSRIDHAWMVVEKTHSWPTEKQIAFINQFDVSHFLANDASQVSYIICLAALKAKEE